MAKMIPSSCIECSCHFETTIYKDGYWWRAMNFPKGIGICKKCEMYGSDIPYGRRSWKQQHIDEDLTKTWYGYHEGQEGWIEGRPSNKNLWWDPRDIKWSMYIYLRSWQNSLAAKLRVGEGYKDPCVFYSVSQKENVKGFVGNMKDGKVSVYRESTDEEKKKYGKKEFIKKVMKIEELRPPESLEEFSVSPECKKCSGCGTCHSYTVPSEDWKGRHFCIECHKNQLRRREKNPIPAYAGDNEHIGFCKTEICGCWSCSSSDLNHDVQHRCSQCMRFSNDGWVDRKTGDCSWFCRECWYSYFDEFKLVRIKDIDSSVSDESPYAHYYNGIWIPKTSDGSDVKKEQIEIVKGFHKRIYPLNWRLVSVDQIPWNEDLPEKELDYPSIVCESPLMKSKLDAIFKGS